MSKVQMKNQDKNGQNWDNKDKINSSKFVIKSQNSEMKVEFLRKKKSKLFDGVIF